MPAEPIAAGPEPKPSRYCPPPPVPTRCPCGAVVWIICVAPGRSFLAEPTPVEKGDWVGLRRHRCPSPPRERGRR